MTKAINFLYMYKRNASVSNQCNTMIYIFHTTLNNDSSSKEIYITVWV